VTHVLAVDRRDGWVLLTLDRPDKRNALSIRLRDAVSDALDDLAEDPTINGVAITGSGDTFSAGFDLSEFEQAGADPDLGAAIWASSDRFHHRLLSFPLPLVAAVNGRALAGGFDLAVCCDVRLAASTAHFAHPEFEWADVVYAPLEAMVGGGVARDLLLTGRRLDADEALRVGLVSQVVSPDELPALLDSVMQRVASAPHDAIRRTKAKALRRGAVELLPTLEL
jgi:enoyl-CoA hydratase/carnithine racemase